MAASRRSSLTFLLSGTRVAPLRSPLKRLTVRPTMLRHCSNPFLLMRIDATEKAFPGSGEIG